MEYLVKTIPKVTSKLKSTLLRETHIKNVCDTPSNWSYKNKKYAKNKSTQNSENYLHNMKKTIGKFNNSFVKGEEPVLGFIIDSLTVHEVLRQEFD